MAVLHAVAAVALAKVTVYQPTDLTVITAVVLALLVGAAALWSAIDAWLGLDDRSRVWFIAALVSGPVSGLLTVLGRSLLVDQTGLNALGSALTGGAAFTALLVLVPAGLGLFVGSRIGGSGRAGEESDQFSRAEPAG
ncbi:hypothetical protein FB471_6101 [Amycolatopsis cihanbeyliensis]|uniref:Uncharacterized protein n=2 Tax=Amycolatopsis cihanbeyliensis TaxID=1128664 RepID=A0A542CT28_AMYCI|nr:hypothetical protein FB471_6101 [Amycolatopsis cihanbeyliensis]